MRELKLNEEEFRLLKMYMKLGRLNFYKFEISKLKQFSLSMYDMAREFHKISEEDSYKIKNLEEKIEGIKRVRVRYDKTKTKRYRMLEKQK
ncbi:hypothetical protein OAJ98_02275 [Deltaproteobacteria bacterium]|nr:hypothetical protein [Deltaproteobacteria bacterium]